MECKLSGLRLKKPAAIYHQPHNVRSLKEIEAVKAVAVGQCRRPFTWEVWEQ